MKESSVVMYMHAGSGNHGCEAIVNSTLCLLGRKADVLSARPEEDEAYSLRGKCRILKEEKITADFLTHCYYFLKKLVTRNPMCYISYRFWRILEQPYEWAVSIGGDNYCYPGQVEDLMLLNKALTEKGSKTILWGASLEPALLERKDVREDMNRYSHIFAREAVSYEALAHAGIAKEKIHFYPDPAFCLKKKELPLPEGFVPGNTVGINISPLILERETVPGIILDNYRRLIAEILEKSDMQIALIPHVVWETNDDRSILRPLYEKFRESGRVILLPDSDCMVLKGYIARLRFLVTARTHASIAAYSTGVPVLVAGYSVKARGIAEDLFGTDENFVVAVQTLSRPEELAEAFWWMHEREALIRDTLQQKIPAYVERAAQGGRLLKEILST